MMEIGTHLLFLILNVLKLLDVDLGLDLRWPTPSTKENGSLLSLITLNTKVFGLQPRFRQFLSLLRPIKNRRTKP